MPFYYRADLIRNKGLWAFLHIYVLGSRLDPCTFSPPEPLGATRIMQSALTYDSLSHCTAELTLAWFPMGNLDTWGSNNGRDWTQGKGDKQNKGIWGWRREIETLEFHKQKNPSPQQKSS